MSRPFGISMHVNLAHLLTISLDISSLTRPNNTIAMASRLIPLKFSAHQVLRPTILPVKIEISDLSPRTPFSAVSPAHHHLLQVPRAPAENKTLETIFEEESHEDILDQESTSSVSFFSGSSSCNCEWSSSRLFRFITLLMMQKHCPSSPSNQDCKCSWGISYFILLYDNWKRSTGLLLFH